MIPPVPGPDPDQRDPDPEDLLAQAEEAVDAEERRDLLDTTSKYEQEIRSLEEGQRRLFMLLEITRGLGAVGRVSELLDRILAYALEISSADRAYLLKKNDDGTLSIIASKGQDGDPQDPNDLPEISQTILEQVLEKGETLYVSDAMNNPDFMAQRSVRELSLRTVVAVPLTGPSGVTGALYVDSQNVAGLLEEEGVKLLESFAAQAGLALESTTRREALEETAETLEAANKELTRALEGRSQFDQILGRSPAMGRVFQVLERVVDNSVSVLLQGETGTGKELVAQALHFKGPRREANFIPVNCGAIPEALLESELFGYQKGAFTGAERDHMGLFETADGGTLFLDEIGELGHPLQVKLLRVLQEGEVRRVGESVYRKVDVRIVAATNRNLLDEVDAGRFREDLFYQINVVSIELPPLRERDDDVLILAESFLERVKEKINRPGLHFGAEARRWLVGHPWPGNVRELVNAVERAGALSIKDRIEPGDLSPGQTSVREPQWSRQGTLKETLNQAEEVAILDALKEAKGNISQAARLLGLSRQHLHTRIRRLDLRDKMD